MEAAHWRRPARHHRTGAIRVLGAGTPEFDLVFGYPWQGEEAMMHDLMRCYGARGARLLVHGTDRGIEVYRDGRRER